MRVRDLIAAFATFNSISLSVIGALSLSLTPASALNVGVSPPRFYIDLNSNKTRSQAIKILNLDSKPVEMKVYVRSWTMDENNKVRVVPPQEQSLEQWIVFTPSRFKIPPGGSQTVRFAIRPRVKPQSGEHRAIIYLQEIREKKTDSKVVEIVGQVGVTVYAYAGDIKRVGVLNSVDIDTKKDAVNAVFDITNQGNASVRLNGQYAVWPAAKYPGAQATKPINNLGRPDAKIAEPIADGGALPSIPVLPDNRRRVLLPISKNLPPGNYVLDIIGDLNGVAIKKAITFTVPLNAPVADNSRIQTNSSSQKLRESLRNSLRRQ